MKKIRFVGFDVHAQTIAAAVAEPDGEVRNLGTIPNRVESVRKLLKRLGTPGQLKVCYEAGPTGYALYWQLAQLGVKCEVIAPTLMPMKARGSSQDRPTRCGAAGTKLPSRRLDGGVGARPGSRGIARPGARTRGGEKGSAAGAASAVEVFAAPRAAGRRNDGLDGQVPEVVQEQRFEHAAHEETVNDYLHEVEHAGARI